MDEELIVRTHGEAAVRMARELSENCPPNYFIVEDHGANEVYYKLADPPHSIIKTPYTAEHVRIAHREFFPQHERHVKWDRRNTEDSGGKRDYYTAQEGIANGLSVVKAELVTNFRITGFHDDPNIDRGTTVLRFYAEGKHYTVEVTDNFRDDYASGQIRVDLRRLVLGLRASVYDRICVTSKGIEWNEA
jgi:hypothetical protein